MTAASEVYRKFWTKVRKYEEHSEVPEELWRELDAHGVIRISADGWVAFKATKRGPSVRKKGEPRKASEPAAKRRKASGDHEDEEVKNKLRDLLGKDDDHMIENLMVSKALKDVVMMAAV